jgi:CHAT domain-containing protein/tetratricopeptide (TPR) repeat protein
VSVSLFVLWLGLLQAPRFADSVAALAGTGPQDTLTALAQDHPDQLRDSLRQLLKRAAADTLPAEPLAAAARLAQAYAEAWRDSFLVRQVARFAAWSPAERREKVAADSVRLAGNAALGGTGVAAALSDWRESLRRCATLHDSAGMAAALGNIGAGYYRADELDSAAAYFEQAATLAQQVGDHRTAGNAIGALASVHADRGEPRRAAELYRQAARIRTLSGDERGAAADRNNLGLMSQSYGDLDGARTAFVDALTANRRAGRDEPAAVNLINLGNLAALEGNYADAAVRYHDALVLYRAHANRVGAATVLHDLGLLALQRGDYRGAIAQLSQALAIFQATGPPTDEEAVRRDLAGTHAAMGNLQGALMQLGRAERLAATNGAGPGDLAQLALERADLAVRFNMFPEAKRQYARAADLARRASDGEGEAAARRGLALLLLDRGDYPQARRLLQLALHAETVQGDARAASLTRLVLGYALAQGGDTTGARNALTTAQSELRAMGDRVSEGAALGALGDLALQGGLPLAADSLYRRGLARVASAHAPATSWPLHAGLAEALRQEGVADAALDQLHAAIRDIERVSGTLPLEERRAAFLADKWDVYRQLALAELARGHTDSSFEASERLRARQLLDLLARGRVGADTSDTLAAREQDLRHHITVLTQALETPGSATGLRGPLPPDTSTGAVREALARAQDAYAEVLREVREQRPEYASLVTGAIAPVREVQQRLSGDEALLEYLVGDSTSAVFVVTRDTVAAIELGVTRHDLATLVDFSRGVLVRPTGDTEARVWRAPLRRLYRYLIEPVESAGLLQGKRSLVIVPQAELHYAPFAALLGPPGPTPYLVERYRISYAPSASVWARLQDPAPGLPDGVLALAPRVDALPGSAAEVAAIGRLFGAHARVLVGAQATRRALWDVADRQGIIHFATYGVLNKDNPLFSFLELTPQGADDGRLEVHDVYGLRLHARLVVLSACQTGLGAGALADVPAGDDWVGLVEAFLFAGASHVVATLWPVQDRATADLMTRFYAAIKAGEQEPQALAEAQRAMLRNPATAQPFYWAGFTLSGGQ